MRVRGHGKPCYNVLEFDGAEVRILRRFPFEPESHQMASFAVVRVASATPARCRMERAATDA